MLQKKLLHCIPIAFATALILPCAMLAQTKTTPATQPASDEIVNLPTLTVTANRIIPPPEPWRYMVVEGIEVLSNASDMKTRLLMTNFVQYKDVVGSIAPATRVKNAPPLKIILCGKMGTFAQFIPDDQPKAQVAIWYKDATQSYIVVNAADETINVNDDRSGVGDSTGGDAGAALAAQSVADTTSDASTDGSTDGTDTTDSTDMTPTTPQTPGIHLDLGEQMNRAYLKMNFSQFTPMPPAWFEEGMVQLFQRMRFNGNKVTFAEIKEMTSNDNPDIARDMQDFNAELSATRLMTMDELFAVTRDSDTYKGAGTSTWAQQCQAFVHYCLYGSRSKQLAPALLQFVAKASAGPVDETLFKQLFKESYKNMQLDLRNYIENTDSKYQQYDFGKQDTRPTLGEIRDAKDPEVGRMKGQALILAGKPELGRAELLGPYTRHRTDPALLGALGLNELATGITEKGQILLENAAKDGAPNPQVYIVLGRLYLMQATTGANDGKKLTPDQVDKIYKLVLTARGQQPPMSSTYSLLAETLTAAAQPPTPAQLKMLWEGCATYPGYLDLYYNTANLFLRVNDKTSAAKLAAVAERVAQTPADKQRFQALAQYTAGK